ncbi:MAG: nucleoside-diphosphate kinase [Candidatus Sungbacteria bacterium]|uniref:nucleoside-diphosphate kinase n=1 Tax=Candidatus Sungiibacteriota bacterium TaxID=2750080 RepID=A0A932QXV2_9BACT|nr:nucleoside-diphosphate kinase [Candidatus Sungbacteria bacterium]
MKKQSPLKEERTVVLVKPDGVKRGLVGECIKRIEQRGLKVIALKMILANEKIARGHYPGTHEWLRGMGEKTLGSYAKYGKDPTGELGTKDPLKIGKMIYKWNTDFLTSGPMVAMIVSGIHAVDMVRKIVGKTLPAFAEMGTIRGDFSVDSPVLANAGKRAIRNVVHASGDAEEAAHEIEHWFLPQEIHDYKRAEEDIMF